MSNPIANAWNLNPFRVLRNIRKVDRENAAIFMRDRRRNTQ